LRVTNQVRQCGQTFDERCNKGAARALYQVSLPMSGHRSIFHLRWPLTYRDCVEDPFALPAIDCMVRTADASLRTKVANQLFIQGSASLDKKAAVDRLV
jgi:hypothetical protein